MDHALPAMRRTGLALCLALTLVAGPSPAADTGFLPAAIDPGRIRNDIETLASDDFEGRGPGTNGEARTVSFLTSEFKKYGLRAGNPDGTYVQAVPMSGFRATPTLALRHGSDETRLTFPDQFVAISYNREPVTTIADSELVFVGYGVVAPEYGWDDYKGTDLKGKTLVMLINDPPVPDRKHPGSLDPAMFGGKAMTYYGRWTYKYEIAAKLGAAAALIIHETEPAAYPYSVVRNSWSKENFSLRMNGPNPDFPPVAGWLQLDAAEAMLKSAGYSYAELKARALSRDFRPVPLGVSASVSVRNTVRDVDSKNVVARIEGTDPTLRNETIIYSAHWDHFGWDPALPGTKHDQVYHGAFDNASGVASLLAIARTFATATQKPKRSVVFLVTTAEEQGLLGARYYTEHPLYPLATTLADLNIDGTNVYGRTRDVSIVGMGKSTLDDLTARYAAAQKRVVRPEPNPELGHFYRADQLEFARHGVPVLYLDQSVDIVGKPAGYGEQMVRKNLDEDYHQVTDTVKPHWDLGGAAENSELLYAVGAELAAGAPYPTWKKGSEFKAIREGKTR
jgi:Zn-dependent M28 family amino/carboxypeptidase